MGFDSTGIQPRPAWTRAILITLLAALIGFGALAVATPAPADAGIKAKAKQKTKKKIKKRDGQPVKISCRVKGKKGRDGVMCKWAYATLKSQYQVRNCKGESQLKKKKGKLKFKQRQCKTDKGAGLVTAALPDKLLKQGYEATYAFCYTTLGDGYRCKWDALRFAVSVIEDCKGTAINKNKTVTIKLSRCSTNREATAAQVGVKSRLAGLGLTAGQINCRPGDPIKCTYEASKRSGGWTYHCAGNATGAGGAFSVDPCDLEAPDEAPLTPGPGPHPAFGVNAAWWKLLGQLPNLANDFGAETSRFIVNWTGVQPNPPSPTAEPDYDWSQPEAIYRSMRAQNIAPILILQSAPCWATDDACKESEFGHPPSIANLDAWAKFVEEAVSQFPDALAIEVWNEANSDLFFYGAPRPARYEKVLESAYDAVKRVDPSMPVITTGLAPYAGDAQGARRYDDFLRDVYEQGAKGHFDAVGHHGYAGRAFNEDYEQAIRAQLADLKDVMIDYGDQDLDIWITETGVSTAGNRPYSEAQQATALTKLYQQYRRIPGIPTVIVHRWRDATGSAAGGIFSGEAGYGLQSSSGAGKPVYCALAGARPVADPPSC